MWQPDRAVHGPVPATRRDVDALNRIFAESFTDRYRKDGLGGVRVPQLNAAIWHYALADAGEGAMLWRDARGDIVAFNMVHLAGTEGWMGPLAVRTDRQGDGLGQQVVRAGITWLQSQGARTIGLETMPRTMENIGFYSRLGFIPGHLTITLQRDTPRARPVPATRLGSLADDQRSRAIGECAALAQSFGAGADFTREIMLSCELGLGDVTLLRGEGGETQAFTLWHTAPLAQSRSREDLRILKLVAPDTGTALQLIAAAERETASQALQHISVRCQTAQDALYLGLVRDGFRVQWTDLRLTWEGYPEPERTGVVLSNWEI